MFISDAAINSHNDDILGRKKFAHSLAEILFGINDKKSIVIGLYGKWGVERVQL